MASIFVLQLFTNSKPAVSISLDSSPMMSVVNDDVTGKRSPIRRRKVLLHFFMNISESRFENGWSIPLMLRIQLYQRSAALQYMKVCLLFLSAKILRCAANSSFTKWIILCELLSVGGIPQPGTVQDYLKRICFFFFFFCLGGAKTSPDDTLRWGSVVMFGH